ncbi:MAG: phage portal protein, partial [Pseudomonadota bacterium]
MSLIDRLFGRRAAPPETASQPIAPLFALHAAGQPVWTPRDLGALIAAGYARNVIAFRAVRMIAESAAAAPILVERDGVRLARHPLLALLARPNGAQSGPEFFEALYGHLLTAGDAYVQLATTSDGRPTSLHLLRPDRIRVVPDETGRAEAFLYTVEGRSRRFSARAPRPGAPPPVLQLSSLSPADDHYGLSPLAVAARAIDVHNAAAAWSKALLDNAARPSGAVIYKGADGQGRLSEPQYRRLVEELESHHTGARNAGRPMLLEGGLDWKPMGFSPADMEFQKTKDSAAREIALAFGVPPMLLGVAVETPLLDKAGAALG